MVDGQIWSNGSNAVKIERDGIVVVARSLVPLGENLWCTNHEDLMKWLLERGYRPKTDPDSPRIGVALNSAAKGQEVNIAFGPIEYMGVRYCEEYALLQSVGVLDSDEELKRRVASLFPRSASVGSADLPLNMASQYGHIGLDPSNLQPIPGTTPTTDSAPELTPEGAARVRALADLFALPFVPMDRETSRRCALLAMQSVEREPFGRAIAQVIAFRLEWMNIQRIRPIDFLAIIEGCRAWERRRSEVAPGQRELRPDQFESCYAVARNATTNDQFVGWTLESARLYERERGRS